MNIAREIGRRHAGHRQGNGVAHVGAEEIPIPEGGFLQWDPEWARLKRLGLLKVNWGMLYKESLSIPDDNLKTQIKQAYSSFRTWTHPYKEMWDLTSQEFLDQLIVQTRIYNGLRKKLLPLLHAKNLVSHTVPGGLLIRTPPTSLSSAFGGFSDDLFKGALILGAFWIFMNARSNGDKK